MRMTVPKIVFAMLLLAAIFAGFVFFLFIWGFPDPWSKAVYERVPSVSVYSLSFDARTAPISGCEILWVAAIRAHDEHQFAGSPPYQLRLAPHTIGGPKFQAWRLTSVEIRETASQKVVWSMSGTDWIMSSPRSVTTHGIYAHAGWYSEFEINLRPSVEPQIQVTVVIDVDLDGDGVTDCTDTVLLHFDAKESRGLFQPRHV